MPYALIVREVGLPCQIEIIATPEVHDKIINEEGYIDMLRKYILKIARRRPKLGGDSKEVKRYSPPRCCDDVDGCGRSFLTVMIYERECKLN